MFVSPLNVPRVIERVEKSCFLGQICKETWIIHTRNKKHHLENRKTNRLNYESTCKLIDTCKQNRSRANLE